jgi:hypothetical protein
MPERVKKFRQNADECTRLAAQLRNPLQKAFALEVAAAWLELAERAAKAGCAATPEQPDAEPTETDAP